MKKELFAAITFLLIIIGSAGCKKQDKATKPLKAKIAGRWEVIKVETTEGNLPTVIQNYTSSDYYEFKDGDDDIVEIQLTPDHQSGIYRYSDNELNISVNGKLFNCDATVIENTRFEFTAVESGSNPQVVKRVFLKR